MLTVFEGYFAHEASHFCLGKKLGHQRLATESPGYHPRTGAGGYPEVVTIGQLD